MDSILNNNKQLVKGSEKCLDSHLWHACAGGMVHIPPLNSQVFFFPQGYVEHTHEKVVFGSSVRNNIPAQVLCSVSAIQYLADPLTDEVYAKLRLVPVRSVADSSDTDIDDGGHGTSTEGSDKPVSFAKTLTQSDANNGGGFSVPRYCAETIFPRLDYRVDPPVQTILAKDVHGETWKFRHIYRGTPRRHLLTTGWSNFVNRKRLVAGDSVVFLREEGTGDLCVGIRRAKRGVFGGWNPTVTATATADGFASPQANNFSWCMGGKGRVTAESVVEAVSLAATGRPFETVYYPRASSPEFCVKASTVRAAMQVHWCPGMRFKMAFETEDSSRVSWFMGTIASALVADPVHWPNSPWRLLQVSWDEPDLLQNVARVSPWLVELVTNMPSMHCHPFSPPRKKMRFPELPGFPHPAVPSPVPPFFANPMIGPSCSALCYNYNITPSGGIQEARLAQLGHGLHLHKQYLGLGLSPSNDAVANSEKDENVSCLLTMGNPTPQNSSTVKTPQFLLFGQPILTEEQISHSGSSDTAGWSSSSDGNSEKRTTLNASESCNNINNVSPCWYKDHQETGVFMGSDGVCRQLRELAVLGSFEELYRRVVDIFGAERAEMLSKEL